MSTGLPVRHRPKPGKKYYLFLPILPRDGFFVLFSKMRNSRDFKPYFSFWFYVVSSYWYWLVVIYYLLFVFSRSDVVKFFLSV